MKILRIAAYMRVSKDDIGFNHSNSILSQKAIIERYIDEHFPEAYCTYYTDDGYTGMNYNRPSFSAMFQSAIAGNVDIIIVKDLSRLGREYIETGKYIGRIFPSLNIRFIAINDEYDSNKATISEKHLIMPIKSFINECYSRDISQKVRTNLDIMRKNGQYVGAYVAYGYRKSEYKPNEIVVDEAVANNVRKIYVKYLEGYSIKEIQEMLDSEKVITPYQYKKMNNERYYSGFVQHGDKWSYSTIRRILKNEIYIGNLVQGKRTTVNYKVRKCLENEQNKWVKVKNNHEAIIEEKVYYSVQRHLQIDYKKTKDSNRCNISGLLWCGKCGNLMVRRTTPKGELYKNLYICSEYNRSGGCVRNPINEDVAIHIIMEIIKCICDYDYIETDFRKWIYLCNVNLNKIYIYNQNSMHNYNMKENNISMKIGIIE